MIRRSRAVTGLWAVLSYVPLYTCCALVAIAVGSKVFHQGMINHGLSNQDQSLLMAATAILIAMTGLVFALRYAARVADSVASLHPITGALATIGCWVTLCGVYSLLRPYQPAIIGGLQDVARTAPKEIASGAPTTTAFTKVDPEAMRK